MRDDYEYDLRGRQLAAAINKLQNGFPFFLITYNHGILLSSDKLWWKDFTVIPAFKKQDWDNFS